MSRIAFLAPDADMLERAREALKVQHNDIRIEKGLLSEGVKVAASLVAEGTEVIVTRGGTASAIRNAGIKATVVEIPITGFDVIRTVEKAKIIGRKIGVVAFSSMILGIDCLGPILGVDIRLYTINHEREAEYEVLRAFRDGVDVVIGGVITGKVAGNHNLPHALIESGAEGILQAVQEAKRISHARKLEKTKTSLFRAVLDYAYEGIIAVDHDCRVTLFNPVAERITKIAGIKVVGKKIDPFWPGLKLEQVVRSGQDELSQFLKINEVDVLCNKVAIIVNGLTVGAVATFQDISQIQQMESRVRRRIYAAGHVANFQFEDIVGTSVALKRSVDIAKKFALTHSSILILGETGTGKEVFAQSIHNHSSRQQGPFVAINCAALPGQILESELFGYVGGAFTGANQKGKPGLFEVAHGGTIFLDEIAEVDYQLQGKLLRVLQEKKVMHLGGDRVIPVDVRVIAATNQNLNTLVSQNRFRADLYYRLNVLRLNLPPLRDRGTDVTVYAQYFLQKFGKTMTRSLEFTPAALDVLRRHPWPGNIRELQNVIERIVAVCAGPHIDAELISQMLGDDLYGETQLPWRNNEIEEIKEALFLAKGNRTEAAKRLGISRSTLWRKIRVLNLN